MRSLLIMTSVALLACHNESKPMQVSVGPSASATEHDASPRVDVATDADTSRDASSDAPTEGVLLNTPAWPEDAGTLRLTWVLYPKTDDPSKGNQKFVVELVVRVSAVARRFSVTQFGTNDPGGTYMFDVSEQRGCHGHKSPEVASLWLGGYGYVEYVAKRVGDDLVLSKVDLCALGGTDGKCDLDPSPTKPGILAHIPIPHGVAIEERFHVIDDGKHEHDEVCPPKAH
jgi:hypothetical protein